MSKVIWLKIAEVRAYDNNPRINSGAVDKVAKSIELYGWQQRPIMLDKDHVIVCGHTRLLAAIQLGWEEVPCMIAHDLTPAQIKAYRIADNKLAEIATWDYEKIQIICESLLDKDLDISLLDFDIVDMGDPSLEVQTGQTEPDNQPEEDLEDTSIYSKNGEMYQLGNHLLICGNNQNKEYYQALLGEELNSLFIADYANDKTLVDDHLQLNLMSSFALAKEFSNNFASAYVFFNAKTALIADLACSQCDFKHLGVLYWVKNKIGKDGLDYHDKNDSIFFMQMKDKTNFYGDNGQSNVFKIKKAKSDKRCRAIKPVELIKTLLKNSTLRGDIVLDSFGGTGTTLIACEQLGRRCRMIEVEPELCDLIRKRWAEFVHGENCNWVELTPVIKEIKNEAAEQFTV